VAADCWNCIGVFGDRSCPELPAVGHCHNCPVFAGAGRRFLDAPAPGGYAQEWARRLAAPLEEADTELCSVLTFRIGEEWLALAVQVLVEVSGPRAVHRVPHRGGLLAGLVNIRGELHLCVRLGQLLGIAPAGDTSPPRQRGSAHQPDAPAREPPHQPDAQGGAAGRLLVVRRDGDGWVFPVDEVDQVLRFPVRELKPAPATLSRATAKLSRGVFVWRERAIGYLDEAALFQTVRARVR
jgi:chemotaxis-related protein WspD